MTRSVVPLKGYRNVALELEVLYPAGGGETALPEDGGPLSAPGTTLLALHPWGWLGGCMDDPVVVSLCRAAAASGRFSTVVRYNMRGVGSSSGFRALSSGPDTADLVALVRLLMEGSKQQQQQQRHSDPAAAAADAAAPASRTQDHPAPGQALEHEEQRQESAGREGEGRGARGDLVAGQQRRLVVAAYSYGSCVASRALPQLAPWLDAFAVVGFPLGALCRLFLSSGGAWEQLASCHSLPRLLCSGDCDQFTDVGALRTAVRRAREAGAAAAVGDTGHQGSASAAGTQVHGAADATAGLGWRQEASGQQAGPQGRAPLDLAVWPGCDHFFYTGNTGPEEDVDRGPGAGGRQWTGKGPEGGGGAVGHSVGRGSLRPWHAVAGYVVQWAMQHVRTEYGEGGGLLDRPDERRC